MASTPTPEAPEITQSATELLTKFLIDNKMVLYSDDVAQNLLTMSDGSLVVKKPEIRARFVK